MGELHKLTSGLPKPRTQCPGVRRRLKLHWVAISLAKRVVSTSLAGAWARTVVYLQPPMPKGFYIRKSPRPVILALAADLQVPSLGSFSEHPVLVDGLAPAAAGRLLPPGGEVRHSLAGLSLRLEREQEPWSTAPRTALQPFLPLTAVTKVLR